MKPESGLARKIESTDFIVTAEFLPRAGADAAVVAGCAGFLQKGPVAVNVADNHYGVAMSSLAASVALLRAGIEPIYQVVTRDRNRVALQSDLLGAASLGIKNVLCLTGYHQALIGCPESANVFDVDSIQLVAMVAGMTEAGVLMDGRKIEGPFSMLTGAAANPSLKPLDLNVMRMRKKVRAGAGFIQTQAVFDIEDFELWLDAIRGEGIAQKTAILAGVMPLLSAAEAKRLSETFTDFYIPAEVVSRLEAAGSEDAQRVEGLKICAETIGKLRALPGLRGIHMFSGGNESVVPELISMAL